MRKPHSIGEFREDIMDIHDELVRKIDAINDKAKTTGLSIVDMATVTALMEVAIDMNEVYMYARDVLAPSYRRTN